MAKRCEVCFRHCCPPEGELGACRGRRMKNGTMVCDNYGKLTAAALDPIEKKPLYHFHPGSSIVSVGSYGCSMNCLFCQNSDISMAGPDDLRGGGAGFSFVSPQMLTELAVREKARGNIGVAFTYNEPLISWEYAADTSKLLHEQGLCSVMVTNGMADTAILEQLESCIDAMNIDIKSFSAEYYRRVCGGDLQMVMDFTAAAARICHIELTTLIVPGENDTDTEMREISSWIASLENGKNIVLHISRFFPRFRMSGRQPTPVSTICHLAEVAREKLNYVYPGNC